MIRLTDNHPAQGVSYVAPAAILRVASCGQGGALVYVSENAGAGVLRTVEPPEDVMRLMAAWECRHALESDGEPVEDLPLYVFMRPKEGVEFVFCRHYAELNGRSVAGQLVEGTL